MLALVISRETSGEEEKEGEFVDCQLQKLARELSASVDMERPFCTGDRERERERERERDRERGALYKPERDRYIEREELYINQRERETEREELYINQREIDTERERSSI